MTEGTRLPLGLNLGLWDRMCSWQETLEIARLADELGYDCLLIPESFGRDGVTLCDRLLAATENIKVCLGIANVFSRSPAVLASTAATLDEMSNGRFILGLGGSTPNLVEGWHGLRFSKPLQRTSETIDLCHKIWARDRSPYDGEIFQTGGVKLAFQPVRDAVPIWHGAVLEKGLRLCAQKADAWIPANLPEKAIAWGAELLQKEASALGRPRPLIAPTFQLAVHEDRSQVLPLVKFGIAIYFSQANSPYAKAAAALGYQEDVQSIQAAYRQGGTELALSAISDEFAQTIGIVGSIEQCQTRIADLFNAGADRLILTMPAASRAECEPILEGIVPDGLQ